MVLYLNKNICSVIPKLPKSLEIYTQRLILLGKKGYDPFHLNFEPKTDSEVENSYSTILIQLSKNCFLNFGITLHASERMFQRGITKDMLKQTLQYGKIEHEGPQKIWDPYGRKLYTYKNMIIVTNYEQNRIVTVYWKIPLWDSLERKEKNKFQKMYAKSFILHNK